MKKATIAIFLVAAVALGAILVIGQKTGFGSRERMGGPGMGFAFKSLGLTVEQKAQVKQITEVSREKSKQVFEALKANRDKLKEATKNGAFDQAAVTAIAKEQGDLMVQLTVERERTKAQIFTLLTDEQKAKFAELKDRGHEGFRGGRGGHHAGPKGSDGQDPNAGKPATE